MQNLVFSQFKEMEPESCPGLTPDQSPVIIDAYYKICNHFNILPNETTIYDFNKK